MNRRSMLGMLGLGAAAGPAIISQASTAATPAILANGIDGNWKESPEVWNPVEALSRARAEYNTITGDPSAWIADYVAREMDEYLSGYSSIRLETIDPDIRNMKSLSESAKIRMALERKAKRRYESNKNHLWLRIQDLLKEI